MVARRVRGPTSADVLEERSRDERQRQRRAGDLTPGSRVQSHGGSDTPAPPAERRSFLGLEASVASVG